MIPNMQVFNVIKPDGEVAFVCVIGSDGVHHKIVGIPMKDVLSVLEQVGGEWEKTNFLTTVQYHNMIKHIKAGEHTND